MLHCAGFATDADSRQQRLRDHQHPTPRDTVETRQITVHQLLLLKLQTALSIDRPNDFWRCLPFPDNRLSYHSNNPNANLQKHNVSLTLPGKSQAQAVHRP